MFEFRMQFHGEIPSVHNDKAEHGEALERIGREIVDLLRQQGFTVGMAMINGPCAVDVVSGSPPKALNPQSDEVTKNERKKAPAAPLAGKPGGGSGSGS